MQEPSSIVEILTSGEMAVGTTLGSGSPNVAEALGYTPLDFLLVDRQHGSPFLESLEHVVRATDLNDLPLVVRIPEGADTLVTFLLDFGVRGVMLPQITEPSEVVEASRQMRYDEGRSLATRTRAARFGATDREDYLAYADEDLALLPMVETKEAFDRVEELAGLDETTALVVGPADLSSSLGITPGSDDYEDALDRIFEAAAAADCPVGIFVGTEADLDRFADRAAFVIFRSDVSVLTSYYDDVLG